MVCLQHGPDPGTPWQQGIDANEVPNEVARVSTKIAARPRTRAVILFIAISFKAILSPNILRDAGQIRTPAECDDSLGVVKYVLTLERERGARADGEVPGSRIPVTHWP